MDGSMDLHFGSWAPREPFPIHDQWVLPLKCNKLFTKITNRMDALIGDIFWNTVNMSKIKAKGFVNWSWF